MVWSFFGANREANQLNHSNARARVSGWELLPCRLMCMSSPHTPSGKYTPSSWCFLSFLLSRPLSMHSSFPCMLQWVSVPLLVKDLSPHSGSGSHPACLLKNFTPLPLSSFPSLSSSPCLFMSACTGAPIAPVLRENLFWCHALLRLLPGQCQLPWKHALPLLNTLSTSPSLLINPFMWLPSPHFRQWS